MTHTKERKGFKDLNLLDRCLFAEAMEDQQNMELVSEELIELLKYIELSTDETAEHCNSEKVQELHRKICQLKANKQMEAKFMQAWEEKELERQEAYEEGKQAGAERGRQEIADLYGKLIELNRMEDMKRMVKDSAYREKLLMEFGLDAIEK